MEELAINMNGDLMAISIAVLAGIFATALLCWSIIASALQADKNGPMLRTVRDVICPHCKHEFDVPIVIK